MKEIIKQHRFVTVMIIYSLKDIGSRRGKVVKIVHASPSNHLPLEARALLGPLVLQGKDLLAGGQVADP